MMGPNPESAKRVAFAFVAAICEHEVDGLAELMTEDHVFVDSLGNRVEGRQQMKAGWESYFRMVPDYAIAIDETLVDGAVVVLLGTARGTYSPDGALRSDDAWSTPAAWRVQIRGSLVAEWRVYADNEPIRQVMARNQAARKARR
ncbi:MAG: nuclear transport factor 2 family protein [Thermoanaerobaculales bacterium]